MAQFVPVIVLEPPSSALQPGLVASIDQVLDLSIASSAANNSKQGGNASKAAATFSFSKALKGIKSEAGSACNSRGDGLLEGGETLIRRGNVVHLTPEALSGQNAEKTMETLDALSQDPLGSKGASSTAPDMNSLAGLMSNMHAQPLPSRTRPGKLSTLTPGMAALLDDVGDDALPSKQSQLQTPTYTMSEVQGTALQQGALELLLDLPLLSGPTELDLELGQTAVALSAVGKYSLLKIEIPGGRKVNDAASTAKWIKAKKQLKTLFKAMNQDVTAVLENLPRRDLQALAKVHGVRANTSSSQMVKDILLVIPFDELNRLVEEARTTKPVHQKPSTPVSTFKLPAINDTHPGRVDQGSHQPLSRPGYGAGPGNPSVGDLAGPMAALKLKQQARGASQPARPTSKDQGLPALHPASKPRPEALTAPDVPLGMDHLVQQLRALTGVGSTRGPQPTPGKPFVGLLLVGPPGNGKKLLCRTLAADMTAKLFVLDLQFITGSQCGPDEAGTQVREVLQAVRRTLDVSGNKAVLLINGLDSLALGIDPYKTRTCFRAKAELMVGLGQVKQAAVERTPVSSRGTTPTQLRGCATKVVVVATAQAATGLDAGLLSCVLEHSLPPSSPAAPDQLLSHPAIMHVTLPTLECREAILYHMMCQAEAELTAACMDELSRRTEGMSAAQLVQACITAACCAHNAPIRLQHFEAALGITV